MIHVKEKYRKYQKYNLKYWKYRTNRGYCLNPLFQKIQEYGKTMVCPLAYTRKKHTPV